MSINLLGILLIGLFIVIGFLRGIFRILFAFISLLLSALLAKPFSFLLSWFINKIDLIPLALKPLATIIATALLFFTIFLFVGSFIISYREKRREEEGLPPITIWERAGGAIVGGIWGLFIVLLVLTGIEMIGSVEEAFLKISSQTQEVPKTDDFLKKDWFQLKKEKKEIGGSFPLLKEKVQDSLFGSLVQKVNPVDEKTIKTIEQLMTVLSDPELLEEFRSYPEISRLTENPKFINVAGDDEILKALNSSDIFSLLNNQKIADLMKDKELISEIKKIDIERILDEVVNKKK